MNTKLADCKCEQLLRWKTVEVIRRAPLCPGCDFVLNDYVKPKQPVNEVKTK